MSTVTSLVERLNGATSYRDLQAVFSEIAARAQAAADPSELARTIDEVVRRLEQERARDEQELREIQSRYESFQSQHQGVVGWFKRRLPFTQTRREEMEHRADVADQQAEVLADNLVIARAQMIKERILGPLERKLGKRPVEWRAKWDHTSAAQNLMGLGEVLRELASELERSRHFIRDLKEDLDAFAGAVFKSEEDCRRRDADLAAARAELAEMQREVDEESTLQTTGLESVARHAAEELHRTSVPFQEDTRRLSLLSTASSQGKQTGDAFQRLQKAAKDLGNKARQLLDLPAQTQQAREALHKVQAKQSAAAAPAERVQANFDAQRNLFEKAQLELQQKQQLADSAQQFYDAWQAERQAGGNAGAEAETSPVAWKYQEARSALEQAAAELKRVTPAYEAALKASDEARRSQEMLANELDEARQRITVLEEKAPQLRLELAAELDRCQPLIANATTALASSISAARDLEQSLRFDAQEFSVGSFGWLGQNGIERGFGEALLQAQADYGRHQQALTMLERLIKWQTAVDGRLAQEQKILSDRREALWRRRCREILGDALAEMACHGRVP